MPHKSTRRQSGADSTIPIERLATLIAGGALQHMLDAQTKRMAVVLCGHAALGKSTIAPLVRQELERVGYAAEIVHGEGYKRYVRTERIRLGIHMYSPAGYREDHLIRDIRSFLELGTATVPTYNKETGIQGETKEVTGDILIVEYMRPLPDVSPSFTVAFDAPLSLQHERYLHATIDLRGFAPAIAEEQWQNWLKATTHSRHADTFDMRAMLTEDLQYNVEFLSANRKFKTKFLI